MGTTTGIAWTDSTFNPWWGCARVSPGCENCYAEAFAKRTGHDVWGANAGRRTFGDAHWNEPRKWNDAAFKSGKRHLVFCASMADVFDENAPPGGRERLFGLIRETPYLTWQLLSKRPQNMRAMLPGDWGDGYHNVWIGVTTEDQKRRDERGEQLRDVPCRVRFFSYEPALERVAFHLTQDIHWVICGGESGPKARPFEEAWAHETIAECARAGAACFVKQMGEPWARLHRSSQRHGADPRDWAPALRVQTFPTVAR